MSTATEMVELMDLVSSGSDVLPGFKVNYGVRTEGSRDEYIFSAWVKNADDPPRYIFSRYTLSGLDVHMASKTSQEALALVEHIVTTLRKQLLEELTR